MRHSRDPSGPNRRPLGSPKAVDPSGEDPDESAADAVVLADARNGVTPADGPFAGHHNAAVGRDGEIEGAQLRILDQGGREESPSAPNTLMVFSPMPEGPMPDAKKMRPSGANANPLGNGTTSGEGTQ